MSAFSFSRSDSPNAVSPGAWLILALLIPVYVCTMFYRMAPTVLALDLAASLNVATADLALLSGATMAAYGLMQLPSGLLADALGGRRTVCLFTLIAGVCTLWFGAATSFHGAVTARLLVGLGLAVTVPSLAVLARWFPPALYGRASSLLLATGTGGTLLASAPLAAASEAVGWRPIMLACGALSLLLTALVWLLVRDAPACPASGACARKKGGAAELWGGLKLVLATRAFWPLCLMFSCLLSVYFSFAGLWWGPYLMDAHGLDKIAAGKVLFVAVLASIPAMPLLAALSDGLRSRKKVLAPCTLAAFAAMATLAFFPRALPVPALIAQALTFTCACGLTAVAFASVRELFPLNVVGTAMGCLNTLPCLGAALVQKLFGSVLAWRLAVSGNDHATAYADALWVNLFFLAVAAVAVLFTKETYGKD